MNSYKRTKNTHKMIDTALLKIFIQIHYLCEFSCAASVGWAGQRFCRILRTEASSSLYTNKSRYGQDYKTLRTSCKLPLDVSSYCLTQRTDTHWALKVLTSDHPVNAEQNNVHRTLTINVPLFKKLRDIIFFGGENHFMSHF